MARILVTGGSGFIGRNLVEWLAPRHQVLAPPRTELDLLDGAAVTGWMARNPVDVIVHSATSPAHRNADPASRAHALSRNLRMFFHLVAAETRGARFVLLGTGGEYGPNPPSRVREEALGRALPEDDSLLAKLAISRYAETRERFVTLHPFGVYGKHEDWEIRFVSNALCKCLFGKPITLRQNRRFDYVFVDDLCGVIEHFVEHGRGAHGDVNVTPDTSSELLELAHLAREVSGADVPIRVAQEGMGAEYTGSNDRLREAMPGFRSTPPRDGIARLWDWYRRNRQLIRAEALDRDK